MAPLIRLGHKRMLGFYNKTLGGIITPSGLVTTLVGGGAGGGGTAPPNPLYGNRPANMFTVFETDWLFDPPPEPASPTAEGWTDFGPGSSTIIRTSGIPVTTAPVSAASVLECRYPNGLAQGTAHVRLSYQKDYLAGPAAPGGRFPANTGFFYAATWVWIPSAVDFTWNGNPGGKIYFLRDDAGTNDNNHFWGLDGESMNVSLGLQYPVSLFTFRTSGGMTREAWHKIEILGEPNTPGSDNGTLRIWIDGVQRNISKNGINSTLGRTDVRWWDAGQTPTWTGVQADMTYGGNTAPCPFDMSLFYDRWYLAVK
jgi:hypothetical protein